MTSKVFSYVYVVSQMIAFQNNDYLRLKQIYFMAQIKIYTFKDVKIVTSFKILNDMTIYIPLDPKDKILIVKQTKSEVEMKIILYCLNVCSSGNSFVFLNPKKLWLASLYRMPFLLLCCGYIQVLLWRVETMTFLPEHMVKTLKYLIFCICMYITTG